MHYKIAFPSLCFPYCNFTTIWLASPQVILYCIYECDRVARILDIVMLESYINILIHLNCSNTKYPLYSCMQKTGCYVKKTHIVLLWDNFRSLQLWFLKWHLIVLWCAAGNQNSFLTHPARTVCTLFIFCKYLGRSLCTDLCNESLLVKTVVVFPSTLCYKGFTSYFSWITIATVLELCEAYALFWGLTGLNAHSWMVVWPNLVLAARVTACSSVDVLHL